VNPGPSGWRYRKGVVTQPEHSTDPALSRRAALTLALGGAVGALSGCAQGDDPDLIALRQEPLATWNPPGIVKEDRVERNASQPGLVGATDYAILLRIFDSATTSDATQAQAAAYELARTTGWRKTSDADNAFTKTLSTGTTATLYFPEDPNKTHWFFEMTA